MPGIVRDAGQDTAGGPIISGSDNVFAENKPVVRIGDQVASHGDPPHSPTVVMVQGSGDVFTNNRPTCRAGDKASCGHSATGSSTVLVDS